MNSDFYEMIKYIGRIFAFGDIRHKTQVQVTRMLGSLLDQDEIEEFMAEADAVLNTQMMFIGLKYLGKNTQ